MLLFDALRFTGGFLPAVVRFLVEFVAMVNSVFVSVFVAYYVIGSDAKEEVGRTERFSLTLTIASIGLVHY